MVTDIGVKERGNNASRRRTTGVEGRDRGGVEGYMRRVVKGKHGLGINPFNKVLKTISRLFPSETKVELW